MVFHFWLQFLFYLDRRIIIHLRRTMSATRVRLEFARKLWIQRLQRVDVVFHIVLTEDSHWRTFRLLARQYGPTAPLTLYHNL